MEGSLQKWTNMLGGWQPRYLVLSDDHLSYYTSIEKKLRGVHRGYISLRGAAIGIDGINNIEFFITADGKKFCFKVKKFLILKNGYRDAIKKNEIHGFVF